MKVNECMTPHVRIASPNDTLREAAQAMADADIGVLPVAEDDQLVGMLTDRDIAVRGVALGKGPEALVRDIMTVEVRYCYDDQDIDEVLLNMGKIQVRRLPVLNRSKRLVGILSLGDIALSKREDTSKALSGISRHGGLHSQTRH